MDTVDLVEPGLDRLPEYVEALKAGWSPNTLRDVSGEQLAAIGQDADEFLRDLKKPEGRTVALGDGGIRPRLPGRTFWIWDGAFCGAINVRFTPGTLELPPYVSGHLGYAVVPWKRGRGYATQALASLLPIARDLGLPRVSATCDPGNAASRRVIENNGGVSQITLSNQEADTGKLLYWIDTARPVLFELDEPT